MLLTAYEFLETHQPAEPEAIRKALSGNLCRCTGYQNIVSAVQAAAERAHVLAGQSAGRA
jgi:carbon-monoxide dehydrogenase small subunit